MSLSFPSSPTTGQLYPSPAIAGTPVWKWDGSEWVIASGNGSATLNQFEYTGLTTCTGTDNNGATLAYQVGFIEVFVNGLKLNKGDYTATTGTSVVIGSTVGSTDLVTILAFSAVSVSNTLAPSNNLSDVANAATARANLGMTDGQLPATATNDNATTGKLGEFVQGQLIDGSATSLTTGTPKDIVSISLTAGDWDVEGVVGYNPSSTTTALITWVSSSSATLPTTFAQVGIGVLQLAFTSGTRNHMPTGRRRFSLSATTTIYLSAQAAFSGTCTAYGMITARRVR